MIASTSGRPFVVRDPVHGYLTVAPHERLVVDAPITQRLRRIGQTGLAELVFPEAKTSRFVHSLGAMHLASRFVVAALENATQKDVQDFFADVRKEIDWATLRPEDLDELLQHSGALDALSAIRFSSFTDPASSQGKENRRLLALIEGALRLAALFHDLGHLPFSHDLEFALQDFASFRESTGKPLPSSTRAIANSKAPHEEIGHALADIVFRLLPESKQAVRHVYSLAGRILDTPEPDYGVFKHQPASALQWLHSLVDGEIDVDRADYLLRDGQALGLDFAQYDLDRLVSNLVLIRTPELGYSTAINEPGLAALESYCLTRSRSHQVFVRHHKVSQVGTALRYASSQLMDVAAAEPLLEFLANLKTVDSDEERSAALGQYAVLDDGWCFQALRTLQKDTKEPLLSACLGVALDRAPRLRSIWKRKGDLTPEQFSTLKAHIQDLTSADGKVRLQGARRRLTKKGVLFALHRFRPYVEDRSSGESVMLIRAKDGQTRPASQMSPLIRHLRELWTEDIHLYAFAEQNNPITIDEVLALLGTEEDSSA
ncbi:HD domain-containing protein [Acidicapsa ligni]|uniref:HD domain-containing protein n=1 Tax=Acidicapsa ligni TaxID=542300 RepID=UPI0021DF828F|nr:HD domain-containing protein [Acidicapsa ligni]